MDFFEAQARAKKRTSRLVVLFVFAVAGTIAAGYFAAILILAGGQRREPSYAVEYERGESVVLWQPQVLVVVALGTLAVVTLASFYRWNNLSRGGSAVAENVGGVQVDPRTTDLAQRRLLNVVEEMAIASGVPMPAVYVLADEPGINAFAAGLTTSDAAVAVTRGCLEKLSRDELQGVIAHEFSHILNGDMRLNVRLTAILFGILVLGLAGRGVLWNMRHVRTRGKNGGGTIAFIFASGLALLVIGYVGYFFGRLIQAAVSRQREFLADASAVQFTRNPGGITGALKKIGGYALGSKLNSTKSTELSHFFFAQGFRSLFGGAWATHPPLAERIRAIDASFDGKFFEPPQKVAVERESFVDAGLAPPPPRSPISPFASPPGRISPHAAVASIGNIGAENVAHAQVLLEQLPARLMTAAHAPAEAPVLLFGLLLDEQPTVRAHQTDLVSQHAGESAARILQELESSLRELRPEQKLPLLQIAMPALRGLHPSAIEHICGTLDELVHADRSVSTFEFLLQKVVLHTLALGRDPQKAAPRYQSFNAVIPEIAIVLSALARASTADEGIAARAFAAGAAQLKLVESNLTLYPPEKSGFAALDRALDKLAQATGPIKKRLVTAAAYVAAADGSIHVFEGELLRAIAAALDVPMPPLASSPES